MRFLLTSALLVLAGSAFAQQTDALECSRNTAVGPDVTEITSENYPQNYNDYDFCRWYITGPPNTQLTLTFEGTFDVEGSSPNSCPHDKLHIFDTARGGGHAAIAALPICQVTPAALGPYCGQTLPGSVQVLRNTAVVQFCSDYGVTGQGWKIKLSYTPLEAGPPPPAWVIPTLSLSNFESNDYVISSPNFPANYYDDYIADYVITNVVTSRTVVITAVEFNVALASDCSDILEIYDVTNNRTYSYCGNRRLATLEIVGATEIRIRFITDSFDTARGFQIKFSLIACAGHQFACDDNNGCYLPAQSCDGTSQCSDGSDEKWQYCAPECGKPHFPMKENNKIVGGTVVNRHSLPWQAAMLRGNSQFCGGSVISDQWILTAAHCFQGGSTGYSVRVGGHLLSLSAELDRAVTIEVDKVINHPYYGRPIQYDYDVCLLKLKTKIPFRKNIVPVCLPRQGADPAPGTRCMTSGWGNTQVSGSEPGLRQVYVPVVNRQSCNVTYPGQITDRMICAGTVQGGTDSCQGDSGGPFICPTSDGRWSVNGIVSWGRGCALPDVPGVYGNTGAVSHWIIDTIATN